MTTSTTPWIKGALALLLGTGAALWGWFGWLLILWAACMGLDLLSGFAAALKAHEWSSNKARSGLWHKGGMLLVVAVALMLDVLVGVILKGTRIELPWTYTVMLSPLVLVWYALTELGSIIENAVKLGAPVPSWLIKALKIGKDAVDTAGDQIGK